MLERILLLLKTKNLTASQFADEISVQRSSISHLLSGRNNPSLELVLKILKTYPELNSEWLLMGKGQMMQLEKLGITTQTGPDLFSLPEPSEPIQETTKVEAMEIPSTPKSFVFSTDKADETEISAKTGEVKKIDRMVIMYHDHTFREYLPEQD